MTNPQAVSGLTSHTGYWLDRLRGEVHTGFERALAAEDITVSQWCVLITVYRGEATTPFEVARLMAVDSGAITRLVDRMATKGLIERQEDPEDKRSTQLILTEAGKRLAPRLAAIADENDRQMFSALSPSDHRQFRELLGKLLAARGIAATPAWIKGTKPKRS